MRRVMIVAVPVDNDDLGIFEVQEVVEAALVEAGIKDEEDDSQDPCTYEDVVALLNDLGVKVPRSMHNGRNARVKVEHNAQVVGNGTMFVRVNEGDEVVIDHWQKAFNSYACKVPTGQTVWIDKSDLTVG